jgi:hypothetical protein
MNLDDSEIAKIEEEYAKDHKVKFSKYLIQGFDYDGYPSMNQYSLMEFLGEGAFAKVKLGQVNETAEYVPKNENRLFIHKNADIFSYNQFAIKVI